MITESFHFVRRSPVNIIYDTYVLCIVTYPAVMSRVHNGYGVREGARRLSG